MPDTLSHELFARCLSDSFGLNAADGGHALRLVEVEPREVDGSPDRGPDAAPGFALLFRGPLEPVLPQRLYTLEHATLGSLPMFLVPVGQDADGTRYEAVFS